MKISCPRCNDELVSVSNLVDFYRCKCGFQLVPYGAFFVIGEYTIHVFNHQGNVISNVIKDNKIIKCYQKAFSYKMTEEDLIDILKNDDTDFESSIQKELDKIKNVTKP